MYICVDTWLLSFPRIHAALKYPHLPAFHLFTFAFPTLLDSTSYINMAAEPWEAIVSRKQIENSSKIPAAWRLPEQLLATSETSGINTLDVPRQSGILTERQLEITEQYDATDLLRKIQRQELSAYEATEAFCIRAAIA
jgi:hypothetical protein